MPDTTTTNTENSTDISAIPAETAPNSTSSSPISGLEALSSGSPDYEPTWFSALDKAFEDAGAPELGSKVGDTPVEGEDGSGIDETKEVPSDEEDVKAMTPTAGARFKEIKAEAKSARARVAELEAKLAAIENSDKPPTEDLDALKAAVSEKEAKLAEYESELAISRFESTQEYKESVVAPMAAILGVVEDLAAEYEVPDRALLGILEETNRKKQGEMISELAANFSERDRFSLYQLGDDYAAVMEQRDLLRSKASEALLNREKAAQAELQKKLESSKKSWDHSIKSVWETFKTKVPLPEDAQERAKVESEVVSQVSSVDFDKLSSDHKAFAAYSGAVLPHVVKLNKALTSEISDLKSALQKYQKATPGAGSGEDSKPQDLDSAMSFLESIEKRLAM